MALFSTLELVCARGYEKGNRIAVEKMRKVFKQLAEYQIVV